jgi:N-acetylmuramoyl-L-alanine amidase
MVGFRSISVASLAAVVAFTFIAGARAEPAETPLPKPAPSCERDKFRVVLDVGHTADSPGAFSARGVPEYQFNLDLAKRIEQTLTESGFSKTVLLVTGGPGKASLYARMARANGLSADLLVSVHHDSVPNQFKEKWEYDGKPAVYSDRFSGHSIFVSHENARVKDSLAFGSMLGSQLKARGLQYTPHYVEPFMGKYRRSLLDVKAGVYRYDALFVLKKARMPAVLLEAGSIINRDDELILAAAGRQTLIGAAVKDAVESFCVVAQAAPAPAPQVTQSAKRASHNRPRRAAKPKAAAAPASTWFQSSSNLP